MEFPVVNYEAEILKDNVYRYSLDLHLDIESDLSKKLNVASTEFWQISGDLFRVRLTRGLSSPVTMQLFLELGFGRSPGSVWDIWLKVRRVLSPLGEPKLQSVKIVSGQVSKRDVLDDLSNFLLAHWVEFAVGFIIILFLILILKSKK